MLGRSGAVIAAASGRPRAYAVWLNSCSSHWGELWPCASTALLSSDLDCGEKAAVAHTVDIDPDEPSKVAFCVAFELTQAGVQSFCVKRVAP